MDSQPSSEESPSVRGPLKPDFIGFGFGVLVLIGGVIGYLKAGSVVSLVAGLVFGCLVLVGAWLTTRDGREVRLTLVVCTALFLVMFYRVVETGKFMPAGLLTILSFFMIVRYVYKWVVPVDIKHVLGSPA
ncbi:unnamed protein product [Cyprideis torosa]|uniref:Uncharacterized protein n=1 Tax=Cyprideis torosa TaxID=163714 RepID=A0A7R8ZP86_9CRUS|nr:unnamed protein product [Cyprideis torosa]CAG0893372.1 unnamed protein product [Cyprideis torosa]